MALDVCPDIRRVRMQDIAQKTQNTNTGPPPPWHVYGEKSLVRTILLLSGECTRGAEQKIIELQNCPPAGAGMKAQFSTPRSWETEVKVVIICFLVLLALGSKERLIKIVLALLFGLGAEEWGSSRRASSHWKMSRIAFSRKWSDSPCLPASGFGENLDS